MSMSDEDMRLEVVRLHKVDQARMMEIESLNERLHAMEDDISMISRAIGALAAAHERLSVELVNFRTYGGKE